MKWSLNLGKIAGIKVKIHWTFLLLIIWIIGIELERGSSTGDIAFTLGFVMTVFLCVVLHEYGHALTARRYGIQTDKIMLLPIGGVANIQKMPEKPKEELLIAIAGPAVNVVIAGLLALALPLQDILTRDPEILIREASLEHFLFLLMVVNIFLVVFNAIPAFPMDGGRVLRALLAMKMTRIQATKVASRLGQFFAIIFIVAGFFYSLILVLIGVFVFFGAYSENMIIQQLEYVKGIPVKEIMIPDFLTLHPDDTLQNAVEKFKHKSDTNFLVMEGDELLGILTLQSLIKGLKSYGENSKVSKIMKQEFQTVKTEEPLNEVLSNTQANKQPFYPVFSDEKLEGVINQGHLNDFIMIQSVLKGQKA